jgi:hypothetical protein
LAASAAPAAEFSLHSPTVAPGGVLADAHVYNGYDCTGGNVSPALQWSGAPEGTKSFAVTLFDPDAPGGSGWWHWIVHDIPASASGLPEGAGRADGAALPPGSRQGRNDFGASGYGGACPPRGNRPHRYVFTVHALKVEKLAVNAGARPARWARAIDEQTLARASLTATYGRR